MGPDATAENFLLLSTTVGSSRSSNVLSPSWPASFFPLRTVRSQHCGCITELFPKGAHMN